MANSVVPVKLFCHHPFRIAQIQTHEEKNEREREREAIHINRVKTVDRSKSFSSSRELTHYVTLRR